MKIFTLLFIFNGTLLLLHEIESAYEKEWEILNLPGRITGFLLLHIPIIFLLFYGVIEVEKESTTGFIMGIIMGVGGILPFIVHKILVKRAGCFNGWISNMIIGLNAVTGVGLLVFSVWFLA